MILNMIIGNVCSRDSLCRNQRVLRYSDGAKPAKTSTCTYE